jgi:CRISPR-associated endoribonuclease Cas6
LSQKYNAIHDGGKDVDVEVLQTIVQSAHITSYRLQSEYFKIGQVRIPAFMGTIKFAVHSAQTIRNFVKMLLRCGELSGLGIKTAMGMGALSAEEY